MKELRELEELDVAILSASGNDELYTRRGMLKWSMGRHREAMGDWLKALDINPDSEARVPLDAARAILEYRNPDLLNP